MVDDLQNFRLFQTRHGLRRFVVVHQHHALAARLDEVIARERAYDLVVFVQDRVAAVAALEHDLLDVVHKIRQVERFQILRPADALDGDGVVDHPRRAHRVKRRCDDARLGRQLVKLLRQLRLTHDQAVDVFLQCAARQRRLLAADDNGLLAAEHKIGVALRQRDAHLAAHAVHQMPRLIENFAVEHAEEIKNRNFLYDRLADGVHIIRRHLRR